MACRVQALPATFVARTKAEAQAVLDDPESSLSLKQLAWWFLLDERRRELVEPPCGTEGGAA